MLTFSVSFRKGNKKLLEMRKIDILNTITDFRKAPNDIKTPAQLLSVLGEDKESQMKEMLAELVRDRVVKETELNGEKAYQVIAR